MSIYDTGFVIVLSDTGTALPVPKGSKAPAAIRFVGANVAYDANALVLQDGTRIAGAVVTLGPAVPASDEDPLPSGIADPGTSLSYSRGDHVHPGAIQSIAITVTFEDFAALADGVVTFSVDTEASVPEGARLFGLSIEGVTAFIDFGEGLVVARFGHVDDDDLFFSEETISSASGFPKDGLIEAAAYRTMELPAGAYRLTITDNSANDLNNCIAGEITVVLFYF
jgi:hypothetical protein